MKSITIDYSFISEKSVAQIKSVCEKHNGSKFIKLALVDRENQLVVETLCKKFKVNLSNELLDELELIPGVRLTFIKPDLRQQIQLENSAIDLSFEEVISVDLESLEITEID